LIIKVNDVWIITRKLVFSLAILRRPKVELSLIAIVFGNMVGCKVKLAFLCIAGLLLVFHWSDAAEYDDDAENEGKGDSELRIEDVKDEDAETSQASLDARKQSWGTRRRMFAYDRRRRQVAVGRRRRRSRRRRWRW